MTMTPQPSSTRTPTPQTSDEGPHAADPADLAHRRRRVKGIVNLRDLGSIPVAGGRIASGLLYRSAGLNRLRPESFADFTALGIERVYDLRTGPERDHAPDKHPAGVSLSVCDVLADSEHSAAAHTGSASQDPAQVARFLRAQPEGAYLKRSYRDFVILPSARRAYRELFTALAAPEAGGAALFHCTAGKDRTGWAAASLLLLLGADPDDVLADYLATNVDYLPRQEGYLERAEAQGIPRDLLLPMLEVRPEYLETSLAQVRQDFGGIRGYFVDGLGLADDTLERLGERFVS
ncbi:tyrosine-protein phosphatase [Brevibacterium moorei]|uniref:tyrosine-protein phosphatase n=1 Tax=Brevibacterium moorei TaxID=2968457 RepID=UPI00211B8E0D|nr:tyrosine-protein phosphatase [Brevibacterium sp. 68QC2CO]MCQ9384198.1 tyrosine-protein phosphatase [Brevibacterium sp. 68QC2CO]